MYWSGVCDVFVAVVVVYIVHLDIGSQHNEAKINWIWNAIINGLIKLF